LKREKNDEKEELGTAKSTTTRSSRRIIKNETDHRQEAFTATAKERSPKVNVKRFFFISCFLVKIYSSEVVGVIVIGSRGRKAQRMPREEEKKKSL